MSIPKKKKVGSRWVKKMVKQYGLKPTKTPKPKLSKKRTKKVNKMIKSMPKYKPSLRPDMKTLKKRRSIS